MDLIGNSSVLFEYPYIEACNAILKEVIDNKEVNDSFIKLIDENSIYIEDDEILDVINKIKSVYLLYSEKKIDFSEFIIRLTDEYKIYQSFLLNFNEE